MRPNIPSVVDKVTIISLAVNTILLLMVLRCMEMVKGGGQGFHYTKKLWGKEFALEIIFWL